MAVPKRRISHTRKSNRRSHHALKANNISACPHCNMPKQPHKICLHCGFYKDREIIASKE